MTCSIVHVSDLHFGRHMSHLAEALLDEIAALRPTVVAISGDLTQRARRAQFAAAHAWLAELPVPHIAVPGNHDIPLYDVVRRTFQPFARYRRYVARELDPIFSASGLTVLGLNTARPWRVAEGHVRDSQIERVHATFMDRPDGELKVLMSHHPLIAAADPQDGHAVLNADAALAALQAASVDVLLSGHAHVGFVGDVAQHHPRTERSMLAVAAGTGISSRTRQEPNAFNVLRHGGNRLDIEVRAWSTGYRRVSVQSFRRTADGWVPTSR